MNRKINVCIQAFQFSLTTLGLTTLISMVVNLPLLVIFFMSGLGASLLILIPSFSKWEDD